MPRPGRALRGQERDCSDALTSLVQPQESAHELDERQAVARGFLIPRSYSTEAFHSMNAALDVVPDPMCRWRLGRADEFSANHGNSQPRNLLKRWLFAGTQLGYRRYNKLRCIPCVRRAGTVAASSWRRRRGDGESSCHKTVTVLKTVRNAGAEVLFLRRIRLSTTRSRQRGRR